MLPQRTEIMLLPNVPNLFTTGDVGGKIRAPNWVFTTWANIFFHY